MLRNYTRWRRSTDARLVADLLGTPVEITADPATGVVHLNNQALSPDEARLIGVRLIDAAVLADGARAIREPAPDPVL